MMFWLRWRGASELGGILIVVQLADKRCHEVRGGNSRFPEDVTRFTELLSSSVNSSGVGFRAETLVTAGYPCGYGRLLEASRFFRFCA
jgi:hypothetical protein